MRVVWSVCSGTTYSQSAGSYSATAKYMGTTGQTQLIATNGATFYLTGVQLEVGTVATPFEHRSYADELRSCQRYFVRYVSGTDFFIGMGGYYSSGQLEVGTPLPVPMRAAPTLDHTNSSSIYTARRDGSADPFNGFTGILGDPGTNSISTGLYTTSDVSGTAGHSARVHCSAAAARIDFKAEL